jgi:hypothetical protein
MKTQIYLILVLLTLMFTSCLEEVQIPFRIESAKLVVDGGITNESPPYTVRLSYSGNQISTINLNSNLTVVGARVYIKDNVGDSTILEPVPFEKGVYRTLDPNFIGVVGRNYSLKVILKEGRTYISKPEKLTYCPPIDTLLTVYEDINNSSYPDGYQVYLDTKDPLDTKNYYRWSAYGYSRVGKIGDGRFLGNTCDRRLGFNFCWVPRFQTQINIFSDINTNGKPIKLRPVFFSPVYAIGKHLIEVAQFSMSREAYQFWRLYDEQSSRTGTIFDPLPAPIQGNVINLNDPNDFALGYFEVSGASRKRIVIYGRYDEDKILLNAINFTPTGGGCSLPFATCERPEGWSKE